MNDNNAAYIALQKSALQQSIRSFLHYKYFSSLGSATAIPGEADKIIDDLIALYELHYGKDEFITNL